MSNDIIDINPQSTPNQIDRERYEKKWEKEPFSIKDGDIVIEGITTGESNWGFLMQGDERRFADGLLIQKSDTTLINPDLKSPIAFLEVQLDAKIHFTRGKQRLDSGFLAVTVFPRDSKGLTDRGRKGEFKELIDRHIQIAYSPKNKFSFPGLGGTSAHDNFIREKIGIKSDEGLPIVKINLAEPAFASGDKPHKEIHVKGFEDLRNSEILSQDAGVREAICKTINTFAKGKIAEPLKQLEGGEFPSPLNARSKDGEGQGRVE